MASEGLGTLLPARIAFPPQLNSISGVQGCCQEKGTQKKGKSGNNGKQREAQDSKIRLSWKGRDLFEYQGGLGNLSQ